ncbi:hypothetical protein LXL04_029424 [Taraxacum kok-saghyz]
MVFVTLILTTHGRAIWKWSGKKYKVHQTRRILLKPVLHHQFICILHISYQVMISEAFAIVISPTNTSRQATTTEVTLFFTC